MNMKQLNQDEYTMKIVEDLGMIFNKTQTSKARYAIFECTKCKQNFKARCGSTAAKKQTSCQLCTRNEKQTTIHPLYAIWNGIKQRCYSPKRKDYWKYGGKGVTMHDSWINNAQAFIDWCENNGWNNSFVVDKDILCNKLNISPKIYAPYTISFITTQANAEEANAKEVIQYSLDGTELNRFVSATKAGSSVGANKSQIANACRGIVKTSVGFIWKYA